MMSLRCSQASGLSSAPLGYAKSLGTQAMVFVLLAVVTLLPSPATSLSDAALLFINGRLSGVAANCTNITNATVCTASSGCVWNSSHVDNNTNASVVGCSFQNLLPTVNGTNITTTQQSWCYNYFPVWFISTVYFLCCLSTGFALAGLSYHYTYYDVYAITMDGERLYNKYYFSTSYWNLYLGTLVVVSIMLFVSALVYFNNPYQCAYVAMVFVFLVVSLGVPFIALCTYVGFLVFEYYTRVELHVALDEFIRPTTLEAMPRYHNQVRCF